MAENHDSRPDDQVQRLLDLVAQCTADLGSIERSLALSASHLRTLVQLLAARGREEGDR